MSIQTANDAPERDPKVVTLEGSMDETLSGYASGNWELITTLNFPTVTNRFFTHSLSFTNAKPYKHYRWTVTETAGMGDANTCCMQVAEVQLLGKALPQDVTQPGDPLIASSANSPGSEGVANAIDNKTTKYLNFDSGRDGAVNRFSPSGFIVSPSIGRTLVTGMTMQSANDGPERDPKIVTLEGSNDDTVAGFSAGNWELITTIDAPERTNRFHTQTFLFDNFKPYKHYRWTVTETAGMGADNTCCMQVAEVELLGSGAPQDVTQPGDAILASSANSPGSEGVANAIDNKTTKYLNFDSGRDGAVNRFSPSGFVVTPGIGATAVIGMTIQTANDAPERDPKIVTLEGSNDDTIASFASGSWETVATITAPEVTNRFFTQEFFFPNEKAYKHYRWTVTETAGMGADNTCCMQVAEVELLAVTDVAPASARFLSQPINTPALEGQGATFFVTLNGPWPVQWYKNGAPIAGATRTSYTTEPVTAENQTNIYSVEIVGREMSSPVQAVLFTPSATKSIGVSFTGGGANGAPTALLATDIVGVHPQAYWNNATDASGDLPNFLVDPPQMLLDSSNAESTISFNYAATGTWGSGTGVETPTQRLLNGVVGEDDAGQLPYTFTFSNVPDGTHSVLVYVVSPPLQFQTLRYTIAGTTEETYYVRAMNSDEYNAAPGFYRALSKDRNNPTVANFIRFDNVRPSGTVITLTVENLTGAAENTGVNALQLVLDAPAVGAPPVITTGPLPTVAAAGGTARLTVTATGENLTYQWRKNGRNIPSGGNISGATSPTLVISDFSEADPGVYSVAVFNQAGSVISGNVAVRLSEFDINEDLATYLKLDAGTGSTVANTAPGGQPGTAVGTISFGSGEVGNAFTFDGGSFLILSNYAKATAELGASLWINVDPGIFGDISLVRNAEAALAVGEGRAGQFEIGIDLDDTTGLPHLDAAIAAGPNIVTVRSPEPITLGAWHHVGLSADGAQLRLFLDGQEIAATDYLGNLVTPNVPYLSVGARLVRNVDTGELEIDPALPEVLVGMIDELAVWGRALTADEISKIHAAGSQGQPLSTVVTEPPQADATIGILRSGNAVSIEFSGGVLESASAVDGQFQAVPNATSPYTVNTGGAAMLFYRVRGE